MKIRITPSLLVISCSLILTCPPLLSIAARTPSPDITEPQSDPGTALSRGRTLLRQGHADQALGYLETALNSYTQASNFRGIAAAEDALGDLYNLPWSGQSRPRSLSESL